MKFRRNVLSPSSGWKSEGSRRTQKSVPNWAIGLGNHTASRLNIHNSHNFVLNFCENH